VFATQLRAKRRWIPQVIDLIAFLFVVKYSPQSSQRRRHAAAGAAEAQSSTDLSTGHVDKRKNSSAARA
jgi:hypothetical protein